MTLKGSKLSEEHKRNISKALTGKIGWSRGLSKETDDRINRRAIKIKESWDGRDGWNKGLTKETDERVRKSGKKISKALKGRVPWIIGLTKETDERVKANGLKISKANKGRVKSKSWRLNLSKVLKGKPKSKEARKNMSIARMGKVPWNKGLTKETDLRLKINGEKISKANKKVFSTKSQRKRMKKQAEWFWQNSDEYVAKQMRSRGVKPNKLETIFENFLNSIQPREWKFVGDGQLIIGGKCPDFANINGQKKLIEVWGDYWHKDQNPEDRKKIFRKFGYDTFIVWEKEVRNIEKNDLRLRMLKFLKN